MTSCLFSCLPSPSEKELTLKRMDLLLRNKLFPLRVGPNWQERQKYFHGVTSTASVSIPLNSNPCLSLYWQYICFDWGSSRLDLSIQVNKNSTRLLERYRSNMLTLKAPWIILEQTTIYLFFLFFSEKIRLDISCESSAKQTIHM